MANVTGDTFFLWDTVSGATKAGRLAVKFIYLKATGAAPAVTLQRSGTTFIDETLVAPADPNDRMIFYYDGKELQDLTMTAVNNVTVLVEWQD